MQKTRKLTCKNCGWVHFGVTYEDAKREVDWFNVFYSKSPKHIQDMYAGVSSIENYMKCFNCGGGYKDFREAKEGDCPNGVTIQPIVDGVE